MKKPAIIDLGIKERQELIDRVEDGLLSSGDKEVLVETVNFCNYLTEQLKTSKISIAKLKDMLFGFSADNRKKLMQIQ